MQTDSFVASGSSPTPDFELQNHGSIFLLIPQTISARIWIADHISVSGERTTSCVVGASVAMLRHDTA
jgi:hypothetical protein